MKINVGDYVRTKNGKIFKWNKTCSTDKEYCEEHTRAAYFDKNEIKISPNIIDLIEVGDYVNGMEVTGIGGTRWDENDLHCYCEHNGNENWKQVMIPAKDIKSIVTKEMYSSVEYRVENN